VSGFHCQRNVAFRLTRIELSGSLRPGNVRGLSHAPSKNENIAELQETLHVSLTQGTIDRAVIFFEMMRTLLLLI